MDSGYPQELLDLELPPPLLYVRGEFPDGPAVAVVGSRAATPYGLEVAELLGRELASRRLVVVSGFARGIDTAAHRGALDAPAGRTLAVLGCGLDVSYPSSNRKLARRVADSGALISEFALGAEPRAENFPIRNRIIAALSSGTIVVQATPRSGSLITARLALDLGRDVYAVPGSIFETRSVGPNRLIRDGAIPLLGAQDVVDSLPVSTRETLAASAGAARAPLEGELGTILEYLAPGEPRGVEEIVATSGLSLPQVLGHLLELEIAGRIRRYPGPAFSRVN